MRFERRGGWNTDRIGAILGIVVALALLPLGLVVSQVFIQTIPIVIGVASILYLFSERYDREYVQIHRRGVSRSTAHVLRLTTFVGLAGMVFVATLTGGRTVPFFGVSIVVALLLFAQIFFVREETITPRLVLLEIVAFALVFRGAALVFTPGLVGIDAWVHVYGYAMSIQQAESLAGIADVKYFASPLYHLLVVVAADLFHSSLRTALYATVGLVMPLSLLLVYYTSRMFVPVRWALFATAAFSVSDHVVRWSIHLIPNSMGLVLFIGLVYAVARIYTTDDSLKTYALAVFFIVAIVLTHQVSTFIALTFLGAGVLAQLLARFTRVGAGLREGGENAVNFAALTVVAVAVTAVDWSQSPAGSGTFLTGMTNKAIRLIQDPQLLGLASTSTIPSETVSSMVTTVPLWLSLLDALGFLLLLLVAIVGGLTLLQTPRLKLMPTTWIIAASLMVFVTLGMPMLGLYVFLPNRWYAFMYVPFVILAAYGLQNLEVKLSARQFVAIVLVFSLLFVGPMMVDRKATHDNPLTPEYHDKYAFSQSELDAAATIGNIHPADSPIHADDPYHVVFRDRQYLAATPLRITDEGSITGEFVVYREYQSTALTEVEFEGETYPIELAADAVCRPSMDVLYTNGDVQYCHAATETGGEGE
jgi:hypothetical protein